MAEKIAVMIPIIQLLDANEKIPIIAANIQQEIFSSNRKNVIKTFPPPISSWITVCPYAK